MVVLYVDSYDDFKSKLNQFSLKPMIYFSKLDDATMFTVGAHFPFYNVFVVFNSQEDVDVKKDFPNAIECNNLTWS